MDIRYYLVKNGTDTAAKAPYTIRVVPNGVANLNDLVSEILTRISSSEQRVRMVVTEATKVMLKHVLAGETVDFGGIRFKAQIPGSMDYEDSPFRPGVDEVIVCAYVDDELRDTFDGIVPVKLSAEEVAASIKVSNVMDIATENFGEIHGTAPFKVLGNGITLDGEGESAKLLDKKTGEVLATAGVTTVSKGQRATCAFAAVAGGIAKGAYVIEVTTFGLVGETTPRVFRKPVTLVEAIPEPEPVPIAETSDGTVKVMSLEDGGQSAEFTFGHDWIARGKGFSMEASTEHWWISSLEVKNGETDLADMIPAVSENGTKLTASPTEASEPPAGTYPDAALLIHLTKNGATETLALPINLVVNA